MQQARLRQPVPEHANVLVNAHWPTMTRSDPLVAMDGLVASGKSTCAEAVARRLGWTLLSTGAGHRLNTWNILRRGIDIRAGEALAHYLQTVRFDFWIADGRFAAAVDGVEPAPGELAAPAVRALLPQVTRIPIVCTKLTEIYREIVRGHAVVAEGHGVGTGHFPQAAVKFYFDAPLRVRAERRWAQQAAQGERRSLEAVMAEIHARDVSDQTREINAVRRTADMHLIDTSRQPAAACVEAALGIITAYYAAERAAEG